MSGSPLNLSPQLEDVIARGLNALGRSAPAELARDVQALSDFFVNNPGRHTPWSERFSRSAYLSYFLPLNFVRVKDVFREVRRFLPAESIGEIWDFGSGTGAVQFVLESEDWLPPRGLKCVERSPEARAEHQRLMALGLARWSPEFVSPRAQPGPRALAVFSYSFLEMQAELPDLNAFSHILIIEPSTRECGRQLMEWRARWIESGWTPLAPCTHALACPLLVNSQRDWCHMRVPFAAPAWFIELEAHLPMKNRTLTYSYLLLSRTASDSQWRGSTRVIGDTLHERGKTRQLMCRGPEREFLSWLHKNGDAPTIPHGALIPDLGPHEKKSDEVRVTPTLTWQT